MKKRILLLPLLVGFLAACGNTEKKDDSEDEPEIVHVESISLAKQEVELEIGQSLTLTYTVLPVDATNKNVTWESEDTSIVSVSKGKITAESEGSTTVYVTTKDGGHEASCYVTVSEHVEPEPEPEKTEVTIKTVDMPYSDQQKLGDVNIVVDDITLLASQNGGNTEPAFAKDGKVTSIRLYPKNTFKVSHKDAKIRKIEFQFESGHDSTSLGISSDVGTYTNSIWQGVSKDVIFTIADATGGKRAVQNLVITFEYSDVHEEIDLGEMTIKGVKDYISANPVSVNSHQCGIDKYTTVTVKGYALAKVSLIKTKKDFGLNVSEPSKIILGDSTDAIGCATKTGEGSLFDKVDRYQMKDTSRYTVYGYISIYLGQPEIVVTAFEWGQNLDVTLDIDAISKANISVTEFYEKAAAVNYNCAGHGYGETYTVKGLTCYYDESAGQGKDWYNFTDGTNNIRVNAYNITTSVIVGFTYDVTGIISLQNLSPIIIAFKIARAETDAVDLNEFYKSATELTVTNLLKIKGSQNDTDTRYPDVVNSYSKIYKATGYMCIVEENGKLYVGFSDAYKGEYFITGKDNAKANYGVTLIKNDGFWNTTEEKLALFNPYYDQMCENVTVEIYYITRQLGYKENKPMWEILLIPQSIPVPAKD